MQEVLDRRTGRLSLRRRAHDVPAASGDPNNGYATCRSCGAEVYIGTGMHPNLGVRVEDAEAEALFMRRGW
jgi:hypothetical protein